jgi:uncharacterized protein YggE
MTLIHRGSLSWQTTLLLAAVVGAGATVGGIVMANGASAAGRSHPGADATITVTGTGVVTGRPNTLTVEIGVSTNGPSATVALEENNAEMRTLEGVLISAGVKPRYLQTTNLQISPNYDSGGFITSYRTENDLTVTLHDIARSGKTIDAAAQAVGNDVQIQSISFSITGTSALLKTARFEAIQNAEAAASDLASGAHTSLGPIMRITDEEQQTTPPPPFFGNAAAATAKSAVPFEPGTEQLSVQVSVVYELRS